MMHMLEKAFLVFLGAICGVLPVLISQQLQSHSQKQEHLIERRLVAIRDYSTACAEMVGLYRQYIMLYGTILGHEELTDIELELKDVENIMAKSRAAFTNVYVSGIVAEPLFGIHLDSSLGFSLTNFEKGFNTANVEATDAETIKEIFANASRYLDEKAEQCHENTKKMQAEVARSMGN